MDFKEILRNMQNTLCYFYDKIYLIKIDAGYYEIQIDNNLIKVLNEKMKNDFSSLFFNYEEDVLNIVKNNKKTKKLLKTKDKEEVLLVVETMEDYKCVALMYLNSEEKNDSNKKSILVADDSYMITNFLVKAGSDNYNVLVAHDGNQVIDIVNEKNIDAIFLDLEMPLKNGYEVLEYFRTIDLFDKTPVAVISGEDSKDGIEKAGSYGIVDILQKPFSIENARSFIDRVVNAKKE